MAGGPFWVTTNKKDVAHGPFTRFCADARAEQKNEFRMGT